MSRKIDPVVPLAYSAEMLQASVIIGTSNSSVVADFLRGGLHIAGDVMMSLLEGAAILTVASAKGLNEVRKEGREVGRQIGRETFEFLSGGATMGTTMANDLQQGAKGELIHGVKEGGRLFSAAIGNSEVVFERCGTAIIGHLVDENQEEIDRETSQRIADAYQMILKQMGDISVGKDPVMMAHQKAMEKTKQSIAALRAEQEAIQRELALMEEERNVAKRAIQSVDEEMDLAMKASIKEANAKLEASVQELKKNIAAREKAHASLQERNKKQLEEQNMQKERMEELEHRQSQSKKMIEVHDARTKEHVNIQIQRMLSEHGLEDPTIEISEGENNQIRIHIEE